MIRLYVFDCNYCCCLYIATAVDLLVILLIFFARANTRKEYRDIYIGQYLGSVILILVSLFLAFVLNYVPNGCWFY